MLETYVHVLTVLILLGKVLEIISEPFPGLSKVASDAFRGAMIEKFVLRSPIVRIVNTDRSYLDEKALRAKYK